MTRGANKAKSSFCREFGHSSCVGTTGEWECVRGRGPQSLFARQTTFAKFCIIKCIDKAGRPAEVTLDACKPTPLCLMCARAHFIFADRFQIRDSRHVATNVFAKVRRCYPSRKKIASYAKLLPCTNV